MKLAAAKGAARRAPDGIAGLFDRVADSYDQVGPPFFQMFADILVQTAQVSESMRVLDLATGSGAVLRAAASHVGSDGRLVGVDLSTGMLRAARRQVADLPGTRIQLLRLDASLLGFTDQSFDRVLCGFALDLFPNPGLALAECRRVLKPGGLLCLTTWADDCGYFNWLTEALAACQSRFTIRNPTSASGAGTEEGLHALLDRAELEEIDVTRVERTIVYPNAAVWWQSLWTHCPRRILENFAPAALQCLKPRLQARARQLETDGGIRAELHAYLASARRSG